MGERDASGLLPLVLDVIHRLRGHAPAAVPRVTFYSYVDTKCTIRLRDGRIHLRISDHLDGAPDDVLRGVIGMLVCRLHGDPESRVPEAERLAYKQYVHGERSQARRSASRQHRGRKHIDPVGTHRSLLESYLRVSLEMHLPPHKAPVLSWSATRSKRRFGHFDEDHNAIVISRTLDDAKVPKWVLDYVVYHEVLHIIHPPIHVGTRRHVHPPEFTAAERLFPQWKEAEAWLRKLAR